MYLIIDHASGNIEEKEMNKYLDFDSTDENKELRKNIMIFLMELQTRSKKYVVMNVTMKKIT